MERNLIAIVPARSGSKGLKNKNIKQFCGKPLIFWTIDFILKSKLFSRCIVTTDSPHYRDIAVEYGAEVPFLRSSQLASDEATSSDVILNVFDTLDLPLSPNDSFVLFEPTSPIRFQSDLQKVVRLISDTNRVVSISEAKSSHPLYQYKLSESSHLTPFISSTLTSARRQEMSNTFYLNGSFYASSIADFIRNPSFISDQTIGSATEFWSSFEIDYEDDFLLCELIMTKLLSFPFSN